MISFSIHKDENVNNIFNFLFLFNCSAHGCTSSWAQCANSVDLSVRKRSHPVSFLALWILSHAFSKLHLEHFFFNWITVTKWQMLLCFSPPQLCNWLRWLIGEHFWPNIFFPTEFVFSEMFCFREKSYNVFSQKFVSWKG